MPNWGSRERAAWAIFCALQDDFDVLLSARGNSFASENALTGIFLTGCMQWFCSVEQVGGLGVESILNFNSSVHDMQKGPVQGKQVCYKARESRQLGLQALAHSVQVSDWCTAIQTYITSPTNLALMLMIHEMSQGRSGYHQLEIDDVFILKSVLHSQTWIHLTSTVERLLISERAVSKPSPHADCQQFGPATKAGSPPAWSCVAARHPSTASDHIAAHTWLAWAHWRLLLKASQWKVQNIQDCFHLYGSALACRIQIERDYSMVVGTIATRTASNSWPQLQAMMQDLCLHSKAKVLLSVISSVCISSKETIEIPYLNIFSTTYENWLRCYFLRVFLVSLYLLCKLMRSIWGFKGMSRPTWKALAYWRGWYHCNGDLIQLYVFSVSNSQDRSYAWAKHCRARLNLSPSRFCEFLGSCKIHSCAWLLTKW